MYQNLDRMSTRRRRFVRWFVNLQGVIGPKKEGTLKEEGSNLQDILQVD